MTPTHDGATPHDHRGHRLGPAPVTQWVGLFLAPAAFFIHLQAAYLVVLWVCTTGKASIWIHVVSVASVSLGALGLWAAWVAWRRAGRDTVEDEPGVLPRTRLLAVSGLGVSAVMVLLLLAQWLAVFVGPVCP